jgi:hypothetical protein
MLMAAMITAASGLILKFFKKLSTEIKNMNHEVIKNKEDTRSKRIKDIILMNKFEYEYIIFWFSDDLTIFFHNFKKLYHFFIFVSLFFNSLFNKL